MLGQSNANEEGKRENGGDRPRQQTDLSGKALQKEHTGMDGSNFLYKDKDKD